MKYKIQVVAIVLSLFLGAQSSFGQSTSTTIKELQISALGTQIKFEVDSLKASFRFEISDIQSEAQDSIQQIQFLANGEMLELQKKIQTEMLRLQQKANRLTNHFFSKGRLEKKQKSLNLSFNNSLENLKRNINEG
ncbi:hypothetical protein [Flagellimonas onchidii]|uniref:hypothetical protein n=1 Tax=Flagellimonas onchidii TaxID=2562684 RepID=UPI0010A5B4BA|nr:hypothetical protein [Allomuricauda onchidii]